MDMHERELAEKIISLYYRKKMILEERNQLLNKLLFGFRQYYSIYREDGVDFREALNLFIDRLGIDDAEERRLIKRMILYKISKKRGEAKCIPLDEFLDEDE